LVKRNEPGNGLMILLDFGRKTVKPKERVHMGCKGRVRGWAHYGWCEKCRKIVPMIATWVP